MRYLPTKPDIAKIFTSHRIVTSKHSKSSDLHRAHVTTNISNDCITNYSKPRDYSQNKIYANAYFER